MKSSITLCSFLFFALFAQLLFSQKTRIVKDLTAGTQGSPLYDETILGTWDNKLFFLYPDSVNFDLQPWVTDGTPENTFRLHENAIISIYLDYLFTNDGLYYAFPDNNSGKSEIWFTDGTEANTKMLYQYDYVTPSLLTYFAGDLYFAAVNDNFGVDLRKLNLSSNMVEVVHSFSSFGEIRDLAVLNDRLIIIGGAPDGIYLFKSDGTPAGTQSYHLLNSGSDFNSTEDVRMTAVGDKLFFFYQPDGEDYKLYVTDGTTEGTEALASFDKMPFPNFQQKQAIRAWNGKLIFNAVTYNSSNDNALYVSDGTASGTTKITVGNTEYPDPVYFTEYSGILYFMAETYSGIFNVYKTNGTQAGTSLSIDASVLGGGLSFGGSYMTVFRDSLFFYGYRSNVGEELWKSDGTTAGTSVIDIVPGTGSSVPLNLFATDNYLFFTAEDNLHGRELWIYDPDFSSNTRSIPASAFHIFPNPASNMLYLEHELSNAIACIKTLDGKTFATFPLLSNMETIPLHDLKAGIYLLAIYSSQGNGVQKIVVMDKN